MRIARRKSAKIVYMVLLTLGLLYLVYRFYSNTNNELECKPKVVRFSETPMIKTALASYPGAGNTWLRHLIQQVTGIATGSVYCDASLKESFIGECVEDETTIVIKTHEWYDKPKYQKAVLLIRSPFASLGSHFNGEFTGDHKGTATQEAYDKHFKNFLKMMLPHWRWFNEEWMNDFVGPKYAMFYDNLKRDLEGEMRKLMKFLDVIYDEKDFQCMLKNYEGPSHRPSRQRVDILPYFSADDFNKTEEDISAVEQLASKVNGEYHKIARYV